MNHKITFAVGCLSAALISAPAAAGDFQGRWYFGLGGGATQLTPEESSSYTLDETQSTGARIVIGRDLNSVFSIEAFAADLGELTLEATASANNPPAEPYVQYQVAGAHLITYLINSDGRDGRFYRDSFALYAKLGASTMQNEASIPFEMLETTHLNYGLGAEGLIGAGVSWRAEAEIFSGDTLMASLNLIKRFGSVAPPVVAEMPAVEPEPEQIVEEVVTTPAVEVAEIAVQPVAVDPMIDSDGDGVIDMDDRCEGTGAGLAVDARGCEFTGIVEGLYFDSDSDTLSRSARAILDNVVLELLRYPNVVLEVQAHTDNRGSAVSNLELSQRRAEAVAEYMVRKGVSGNRVRARGFGESRPAFRNATEEGRRLNRRVVFQTVEKLL